MGSEETKDKTQNLVFIEKKSENIPRPMLTLEELKQLDTQLQELTKTTKKLLEARENRDKKERDAIINHYLESKYDRAAEYQCWGFLIGSLVAVSAAKLLI